MNLEQVAHDLCLAYVGLECFDRAEKMILQKLQEAFEAGKESVNG